MKTTRRFWIACVELGYIDGKTIQIHARYAGGVLDRLPGLARELVALKVDVIVALALACQRGGARSHGQYPHCHGRCRQSRRCWINREPVPAGRQRHWPDLHDARPRRQADRAAASGGAVGATHCIPVEPQQCRNCSRGCEAQPMPPNGSGLSWWWLMLSRRKTSNRPSPASSSRRRKRCWLGSIP